MFGSHWRVQRLPAAVAGWAPAIGLPAAPVPQAIRELLQPMARETSPVPAVLFDLAEPGGPAPSSAPFHGADLLQALFGEPGRPSPNVGSQHAPVRKVPPVPPRKPRPAGQPLTRPAFLAAPNFGALTREQGLELAERLAGMPVPGYKSQYRPGAFPFELGRWGYEVDRAGIEGHARRAFMETFAAEGGFTRAKGTETYAGITEHALKDASTWAGITADSKPRDLNPEERRRSGRSNFRISVNGPDSSISSSVTRASAETLDDGGTTRQMQERASEPSAVGPHRYLAKLKPSLPRRMSCRIRAPFGPPGLSWAETGHSSSGCIIAQSRTADRS